MLISIGITASEPYTKEKGVSPVIDLRVIQNTHSTNGSSSGHCPFALFNLLFSPFRIVWMVTSVRPLDYVDMLK